MTQKHSTDFQKKIGVKVAHGQRKKPWDVNGNPDHDTSGLKLGLGYGYGFSLGATLGLF